MSRAKYGEWQIMGWCYPGNALGASMLLWHRNRNRAEEMRRRVLREACPQCGSPWFKRHGHMHNGNQNHRCKQCGRAFVRNPANAVITKEQRKLIERLLLESI